MRKAIETPAGLTNLRRRADKLERAADAWEAAGNEYTARVLRRELRRIVRQIERHYGAFLAAESFQI